MRKHLFIALQMKMHRAYSISCNVMVKCNWQWLKSSCGWVIANAFIVRLSNQLVLFLASRLGLLALVCHGSLKLPE